jgi:hypothetical protein
MSKESKNTQSLQQRDLSETLDNEAFRVEAVLSKLPIHILNDDEDIDSLKIQKAGLSWEVSPGRWGMPGSLAYKIDSIFINHRIDESRPALPKVIKLGSSREILRELGMAESGTNVAAVRRALRQNASAFIQADVPYWDKGKVGSFEFEGTRYVLTFQNQNLPDGTKADAIYIVFHDVYLQFLRSAPVRPISSTYLKYLSGSPFAQRLYEILSFQFYDAFKQRRPYAVLRYSEYCTQAPLPRKSDKRLIYQQMWRIHNPHIMSRYIKRVEYEAIEDSDFPDFNIKYYPGVLARQEYDLFRRKSLPGQAPTSSGLFTSIALPGNRQMPEALTPSQELVAEFQTLRFGESQKRIARSEERLAAGLIDRWGFDDARAIVNSAFKRATEAGFRSTYLTSLVTYIRDEEERYEKLMAAQKQRGGKHGGRSPEFGAPA